MNAFLRRNWLVLLLAVVVVMLGVMFFNSSRNNENELISSDNATGVINAPAPAILSERSAGADEAAPAGSYLFCVRLDGRQNGHLPALIGGGPGAYSNGQPGGYNWGLFPSATGSEDYGILPDGTVFLKTSYLTANGMVQFAEYIGAPAWVPIQMTEAMVGGQAALTYKISNF